MASDEVALLAEVVADLTGARHPDALEVIGWLGTSGGCAVVDEGAKRKAEAKARLRAVLKPMTDRIAALEAERDEARDEEHGNIGPFCCPRCTRSHPHGCLLPLQAERDALAAEVAAHRAVIDALRHVVTHDKDGRQLCTWCRAVAITSIRHRPGCAWVAARDLLAAPSTAQSLPLHLSLPREGLDPDGSVAKMIAERRAYEERTRNIHVGSYGRGANPECTGEHTIAACSQCWPDEAPRPNIPDAAARVTRLVEAAAAMADQHAADSDHYYCNNECGLRELSDALAAVRGQGPTTTEASRG